MAMADSGPGLGGCVSLFRTDDGAFVRHLVTGLANGPVDVEECADSGWAVAEWHEHTVTFAGDTSDQSCLRSLGKKGSGDGEFTYPGAVAFVPGLGLVVREFGIGEGIGGRVQIFATPDAVAMAAMSAMRTTYRGYANLPPPLIT